MAKRYRIPEIRALPLLSSADIREDGSLDLRFDVEEIAGEANLTWTMQDDCPMFHQARQILKGGPERKEQDVLSDVFVYIDFSGIFDRRAVGRVAELQKRAEWLFRPEGIPMHLQTRFYGICLIEARCSRCQAEDFNNRASLRTFICAVFTADVIRGDSSLFVCRTGQ